MQSNYQKLIVWQKAIVLSTRIYETTKTFPKDEIYGLTSQIRRAAVSIPSNIAEWSGRNHVGEYVQFLAIARGSCNEIETQIIIAKNLNYLTIEEWEDLLSLCEEVLKMLASLIKNLSSNT